MNLSKLSLLNAANDNGSEGAFPTYQVIVSISKDQYPHKKDPDLCTTHRWEIKRVIEPGASDKSANTGIAKLNAFLSTRLLNAPGDGKTQVTIRVVWQEAGDETCEAGKLELSRTTDESPSHEKMLELADWARNRITLEVLARRNNRNSFVCEEGVA